MKANNKNSWLDMTYLKNQNCIFMINCRQVRRTRKRSSKYNMYEESRTCRIFNMNAKEWITIADYEYETGKTNDNFKNVVTFYGNDNNHNAIYIIDHVKNLSYFDCNNQK